MQQQYQKYTQEDQEVWNILAARQLNNLPGKAHPTYLNCLEELEDVLNPNSIPKFEELNSVLMDKQGWSITVVPGLIPVEQFFELLKNRKFSASTWLRNKSQLNYLEEPDMFHDIFGHIPMLMNEPYADFAQKLGELGVKYIDDKKTVTQLQRLYWFTIEFGLIQSGNEHLIYGAGIISSSGETDHVMNDDVEVVPYDIFKIIEQDFITSEIQTKYFSQNDFDQLYTSIENLEKVLSEVNETA
ncbi:MAG: phenylalanine 4-monooxygenase [Balneola sp.]|jgi:phenylalanine-4-hydroxylase|nr:phenylalanine 4-monooxygenase [Balneola sp.]MBE80303.1 phenylalanine 4-monooxygenase [Balneola sp.]HBX65601.1 phenylalanine 4-monooxygenase [Balneolaceae bacterium]|tara:strand:+ start:473 stop:1201 length:729 start_codon:yes stop_codon:yes gene_type:complete